MKKFLIAFLIIVAFAIGGYLFYIWYKIQNLTVWSFIPSDAIAVYQPKNLVSHWNENEEKKIWKNISSFPFIKESRMQLQVIDSLLEGNGFLENYFRENDLLLSVHITSKDNLGLLIALELPSSEKYDFLKTIIKHYLEIENFSISTRQYLGYSITELSHNDTQFSYLYYHNFFIGSFTSFLIEDVIRLIDDTDYISFKEQNQAIFGLSKTENDQGYLFVNSKKLATLIGVFTDPMKINILFLEKLTYLSFLDIAVNDKHIIFNGFSLNNAARGNYLESFDGVKSSEFLMNTIVPINTSMFFYLSFDDGEKWYKNLKNFWRKNSPELLTNIGELENKYDFPVNKLNTFIGNELGIMFLETGTTSKPDRIVGLHVKDTKLALDFFNQLSDNTNKEADTYSLQYKGYLIRQIVVDEVPMRFFGLLFSGFPTTYYTEMKGYILMANSEVTIKNIINNILAENTWSKSLKMNNFMKIANSESNLSFFIKTESALNQFRNKLNDKWLSIIKKNIKIFNQIDYCVVQFSNIDEKFYTNITIQHSEKIIENSISVNSDYAVQIRFPFILTSKPFGVKNHNNKSIEFVVQDEQNNFYLLSSSLDTLWNIALENKIVSNIFQVDYYKNNKLQYLFATENNIHIIDRTGAYVSGYPFNLPDKSRIMFLSLIDYDGSKHYRILATNSERKHFMFDKLGKNMEGWNPRELNNDPVAKPFHMRVRNFDVLVFVYKNGIIELLNRRGKSKTGFPLNLDKNIGEEIFVEKEASLSSTFLTVLSEDGELIKFNLNGKIKDRKQLFRNSTNDKFQLVVSSDKRIFVILRIDENQVSILDADGKEKYVHNYPLSSFSAQYYNFSPLNQVLVLTDSEQEFTYLYDVDGNLINGKPINTGNKIAMLYQSASNSYKIFLTYGVHFSMLKMNR